MKDIYHETGIYRITNKLNGKSYIGKTGMNFGDRWDSHRSLLNAGRHDNPHLQSAWNKYGQDAFEFAIVEIVGDPDRLNEREMFYIAQYREHGLSYNIHDGGDGGINLGKHLSDETKRKIGAKNSVNMLGRKASADTKRKMSESQIARYKDWTDEDRSEWGKISSANASGYKWSDEARERFSTMQRERPNGAKFTPDDIRAIRSKHADGVTLTELAAEYHTSPTYVSHIVHRRRWAEII